MVSEARMAWMEMDYSKHTHFRWTIKWRLERDALGIMGEGSFCPKSNISCVLHQHTSKSKLLVFPLGDLVKPWYTLLKKGDPDVPRFTSFEKVAYSTLSGTFVASKSTESKASRVASSVTSVSGPYCPINQREGDLLLVRTTSKSRANMTKAKFPSFMPSLPA